MALGAKRIGGISVGLEVETSKWNKGLSSARTGLKGFAASVGSTIAKVGALGAAMGGVAAGGMAVMVKRQLEAVDTLAKTSDRLGIATETLAGLEHAADLAGASAADLATGLQKMQRSIVEGSQGTGTAVTAFNALGLSAEQLLNLPADKQLGMISDAINGLGTAAERTTASMQIFGRGGTKLQNMMMGGSAGIREATAEAEKFGLAISRVDAASIEMANDAVTKMVGAFSGVARQLAVAVAPAITAAAEATAEWMSSTFVGGSKIVAGMGAVGKTFGAVADGVQVMVIGIKGYRAVALGAFASVARAALAAHKAIVGVLDSIPGVEIQSSKFLESVVDKVGAMAEDAKGEFDKAWLAPPPSVGINRFFDDIQERSEDAAAKIAEMNRIKEPSLFERAKSLAINTGRNAQGAAEGLGGLLANQFKRMAMDAGAMKPDKATSLRPSLSFAESGSVESYRQQASIRSQRDAMKLDKDRNGLLKELIGVVKNQPPLAPAGIG